MRFGLLPKENKDTTQQQSQNETRFEKNKIEVMDLKSRKCQKTDICTLQIKKPRSSNV